MGFIVSFSITVIYLLFASGGAGEGSLTTPKTIKNESASSFKSQSTCQQKILKKTVAGFLWVQDPFLFTAKLVVLSSISKELVPQLHPRTLRIKSGLSPPV